MRSAVQPPKKAPFPVFIAASVVFFFLLLSVADSVGFVPCTIDDTCEKTDIQNLAIFESADTSLSGPITTEDATSTITAPPVRIQIPFIDLDLPVQNPLTTDLAALDVILKDGPARHALSGRLGDDRRMIIFAHSSNLPVVRNLMYKAFNRVPELNAGDSILIDGEDGTTHLYSVATVEKADANTFDENFLALDDQRLILVTCDTLTSKTARYIVRAEYVGIVETNS